MLDRIKRLKYSLLIISLSLLTPLVYGQCEVDAGEDISICAGESVQIGGVPTIVDSGPNPQLSWDNGAGNSTNPTVSPATTTTYEVTLTDDDGCEETDQITVTVNPLPTADFSFNNNGACGGTPVQFTNLSNGTGLSYEWDFDNPASGAANSSTQLNPVHEFVAFGNGNTSFNVTLTVTDVNGCSDQATINVPVTEAPDPTIGDVDIFTPFEICGAQGQTSFDLEPWDYDASQINSAIRTADHAALPGPNSNPFGRTRSLVCPPHAGACNKGWQWYDGPTYHSLGIASNGRQRVS